MASMDRVMELNFKSTDEESYFQESHDWSQPHVFQEPRHTEKIEGSEVPPQGWRMKERMKTVSVALVLCLNVGVDPPGTVKLQPCARHESWVDPLSLSPQKALEQIGSNLQKQYERWQPRARYKQSLDPTVDEVKKLCVSLRRNAKEERVLFHYNGHGVPCPTTNGEIWVFNRNYTQYIPLSIYDLQTWMGYPSIYVYDCNNAGIIIKSFAQFAEQHEREYYAEVKISRNTPILTPPESSTTGEETSSRDSSSTPTPPNYSGCIQLGACSESQTLPMNPDLPADLFTACLTTPIRMALRWFVLQNQQQQKISGFNNKLLGDGINLDSIEKVPGQLNDRRTMLGELNWIFTAITDTIAWNILPRSLFQRLFRQDLLVASLFRNFLLAERIMRSYDCTPVSSPKLPPTSHHPMWHAWDYALDQCLTQLMKNKDPENGFVHTPSPFFEEQLTAFEVWLGLGGEKRKAPEQLPIVLQVLLSQVHRVRALELLGRFLDLGWWAVNLALSVGIFPYVLKLLQSSAKELRPLLVFIWAKILAVDETCQADLVRDGSHKYFIQMVNDQSLPQEYRTMAVYVLSNIVRNYPQGQQASLQANLIATCLLTLEEESGASPCSARSNLYKWVCICLGLTWQDFPSARWCGVRDSAHEKIATVLTDQNPEVRAAGVFALGCFINGIDRTEHSNAIDHSVVLMILNKLGEGEGSWLVREEIIVALQNFVLVFEGQMVGVAERVLAQEQYLLNLPGSLLSPGNLRRLGGSSNSSRMRALAAVASANPNMTITGAEAMAYHHSQQYGDSMRRVASSSSLSNLMNVFIPPPPGALTIIPGLLPFTTTPPQLPLSSSSSSSSSTSIYSRVYNALATYERDPHSGVALLAKTVLDYIRSKAYAKSKTRELESSTESVSRVSSSSSIIIAASPTTPTRNSLSSSSAATTPTATSITPIIATKFVNWCWSQYSRPNGVPFDFVSTSPKQPESSDSASPTQPQRLNILGNHNKLLDPQDPLVYTRNWVYNRNASIRRDCFKRTKGFPGKIEDQVVCKNLQDYMRVGSSISTVKFHPYENLVVVGGPAVVGEGVGGSSSGNSSLGSNLDLLSGMGGSEYRGRINQVVDKSVFLIFEYDDTSTLMQHNGFHHQPQSHHHHHHGSSHQHQSGSSASSSSYVSQTRIVNKTEIEHCSNGVSSSTNTSPVLNSIEWLNPHDSIVTSTSSLLATGCNDGFIRVYKPYLEGKSSELITAWSLGGNNGRVSNVLMRYEVEFKRLAVAYGRAGGGGNIGLRGGGNGVVSIWDVESERLEKEVEYPDCFVSCLDCNRCEPNVFVIGGEDGSVRLLDLRVPNDGSCNSSSVWKDFNGISSSSSPSPSSNTPTSSGSGPLSTVSVRLRHDRTVVAGTSNGKVRFYDLRSKSPTKTIDTTLDVTSVDIHPNLPYFGIGTTSSTVNIYGSHGQSAFLSNSIREGFGGFGRIGLANNSITSLSFHEFKPFVCFVDSYSHFSVYKSKK